MKKWATIACEQFTSNQSYWDQVASELVIILDTYKITFLQSFYLGKIDEARNLQDNHHEMGKYLSNEIFSFYITVCILVVTEIDHGTRYGL
jgi:hypothetical protein